MLAACRTCLQSVDSCSSVSNPVRKIDFHKLTVCIPELNLRMLPDMGMCKKCIDALDLSYNFKMLSLKSELLINDYIRENINAKNCEIEDILIVDVDNSCSVDSSETSDFEEVEVNECDTFITENVRYSGYTRKSLSKARLNRFQCLKCEFEGTMPKLITHLYSHVEIDAFNETTLNLVEDNAKHVIEKPGYWLDHWPLEILETELRFSRGMIYSDAVKTNVPLPVKQEDENCCVDELQFFQCFNCEFNTTEWSNLMNHECSDDQNNLHLSIKEEVVDIVDDYSFKEDFEVESAQVSESNIVSQSNHSMEDAFELVQHQNSNVVEAKDVDKLFSKCCIELEDPQVDLIVTTKHPCSPIAFMTHKHNNNNLIIQNMLDNFLNDTTTKTENSPPLQYKQNKKESDYYLRKQNQNANLQQVSNLTQTRIKKRCCCNDTNDSRKKTLIDKGQVKKSEFSDTNKNKVIDEERLRKQKKTKTLVYKMQTHASRSKRKLNKPRLESYKNKNLTICETQYSKFDNNINTAIKGEGTTLLANNIPEGINNAELTENTRLLVLNTTPTQTNIEISHKLNSKETHTEDTRTCSKQMSKKKLIQTATRTISNLTKSNPPLNNDSITLNASDKIVQQRINTNLLAFLHDHTYAIN